MVQFSRQTSTIPAEEFFPFYVQRTRVRRFRFYDFKRFARACQLKGSGSVPKKKFAEEYLRLIKLDLEESQAHRHEMPKEAKRGLSDATIDFFKIGYLPNWVLTKSRAEFNCGTYVDKETGEIKRLPPPSERVIIPTASGEHFNAVATPAARRKMMKDFWKQHAGEKELFGAPDAWQADTVLVVEGEYCAASIWQATQGKVAVVAMLGAANWKKTLLVKLDDVRKYVKENPQIDLNKMHVKRFVLMLDADDTGKKNAQRLQAEMLKRGYPAVYRTIYEALTPQQRQSHNEKVDANDILQEYGNDFLNDLIQNKILNEDTAACLDKLEAEIKQGKYLVEDKPRNTEFSAVTGADVDEIKVMLKDFVHAKDLTRDEWWAVGSIMFRYGFKLKDFHKWSNDGDDRYDESRCDTEWNGYKTAQELQDDDDARGYTIGTLIQLAKEKGYVPPRRNPHVTGDKDVDEWQKVNGVINPELLAELQEAAEKINACDAPTAALANDITTQRYLGAMKYYSPFSHITRQFLIKLQDAKNAAVKKVSAFKKDSSAPEPTDIEKELAMLRMSVVNKNVEQYATQAKKNHAKYVESVHRKEIAEKRNQPKPDNVFEPETTQALIANCPVDLELPPNVAFSETGINVTEIDRNGEEIVIEACSNPIVPTKILRESATHFTKYEVAIMCAGKWTSVVVDGKTLEDGRSISALSNFGAHILDHKTAAKFFAKLVATNENNGRLKRVRMYIKPGWYDGNFIYPATDEADFVVMRNGIDYKSIFATRGDKDAWKLRFYSITDTDATNSQGALKRIALGACLVAPLVSKLQIMNPQINIWGTSNFSKTPLIKFGLSVYGDPTEGQLMRTWSSSAKNMMTMSAGFNCFPYFVDEGETMPKKMQDELPEFIYNFSTGVIGQNNKRNGDVRPVEKFHSVRISTAERPLHDVSDKRGAYKRLIDLHVKKPLFTDRQGYKLHIFCGENYGLFGREWVQFIAEHEDEIVKTFDGLCDYFENYGFTKKGKRIPFGSVDATNARTVLACATAIYHFFHCLEFTNGEYVYDDMKADINEILAELPTVAEINDVNRSFDLLKAWVSSNYKRFIKPQGGDTESYAPDAGRIFSDGRVAIYPNVFKQICKDVGIPSSEKFLRDLYDDGLLDCTDWEHRSKSFRANTPFPGHGYHIKLGDFSSTDYDKDEESSYDAI